VPDLKYNYEVLAIATMLSGLQDLLGLVCMTVGFTIYGTKIAVNLKRGRAKSTTPSRDTYLYKVTVQTVVVSAWGALLSLLIVGVVFLDVTGTLATEIIQCIEVPFLLYIIGSVAYLARPPQVVVPKDEIPMRNSDITTITTTQTPASGGGVTVHVDVEAQEQQQNHNSAVVDA